MVTANTDLIKALCNYLWHKIYNLDLTQKYKKINIMIKVNHRKFEFDIQLFASIDCFSCQTESFYFK